MANGSPSGITVPDARSPVPSSTSSGAPHKKATKRTRQFVGDEYVLDGDKDNDRNPGRPRLSMPFVAVAAMMFLLREVFDGPRQQNDPALVPFLTAHA